jgi:hypothetical protein
MAKAKRGRPAAKKKAAPKKRAKKAAPKKKAAKKGFTGFSHPLIGDIPAKRGVRPGRNANSPKYRNKQVKKKEPVGFSIAGYSILVPWGAASFRIAGYSVGREQVNKLYEVMNNK